MSVTILPYIPQNITLSDPIKKCYSHLQQQVAPRANDIDTNTRMLVNEFKRMGELGVLGVDVAEELGGLNFSNAQRHYFLRNMVRASEALNLLQIQHQTALKLLSRSENLVLQKEYLPAAIKGEIGIGIGISHLRSGVNNPPVRGVEYKRGYKVNGTIRFVTGHKIFQHLAVGFVNELAEEMIALIPFEVPVFANDTLLISKPIDLPVTKSARTVSLQMKNFYIAQDNIIVKKPKGSFCQGNLTRQNLESQHAGVALALLDLIATSPRIAEKMIADIYQKCIRDIEQHEKQVIERGKDDPVAPIRGQGILLVNQCLLFAEQVFQSLALNKKHALYRLRQEAVLVAIVGAGDDLLAALLME